MSITIDAFLEHHGVKGQKWGVRHDPGHEGEAVKTKKLRKLDQKWMDKINKPKGWDVVAVHNRVADKVNANIEAFNNKPEYKNANLNYPERPVTQKYMRDHEQWMANYYKEAVNEIHGTSPSGAFKAQFVQTPDGGYHIAIRGAHIEHATTSLDDLDFEIELDKNGKVSKYISLPVAHSETAQSNIVTLDFLEHHGIKGQHWGIRNRFIQISKTVGRGAKRAGKIAYTHPHATVAVLAGGAALTAAFLHHHGSQTVTRIFQTPYSTSGQKWVTNYPKNLPLSQLWNYKP